MIPLFENTGLIGLGLMGGSLARAIKKHGISRNITGYTKSAESSQYALKNGIIDNIADSSAQLAKNCDIIIICTPLSTYDGIFAEISPAVVGKNCIITDVGSLKLSTIKIAEKYLSLKNLVRFVPAHPIAGTEKTGIEYSFAELYNNKKTILTPLKNTDASAISLVSDLWHRCGSKTQVIDAAAHDKIYAEVSHLPQFLAYCYALLLLENNDIIANNHNLKNNDSFWQFSRICASDPTIWLDIFSMNFNNLAAALYNFSKAFTQHKTSSPTIANDDEDLLYILPAIIAEALIKYSHNSEYAGSGFSDFTSYNNVKYVNSDESEKLIKALLFKAHELLGLIRLGDKHAALALMKKAADGYVGFKVRAFL